MKGTVLLAMDHDGSMPFMGKWNEGTDLFEYEVPFQVDAANDMHFLALLFREANIGEGEWADGYRRAGQRSLSAGDAVLIEDAFPYRCEAVGWTPVTYQLVKPMIQWGRWSGKEGRARRERYSRPEGSNS